MTKTSDRNSCEILPVTLGLGATVAAAFSDGARQSKAMASRVMAVADQLSQGAGSLSADVGTFVGKISG